MGFGIDQFKARVRNDWAALNESQRSARMLALGVIVVAVTAVPAWFLGRPWWERWQRGQALEQARVFVEQRDYRSATLALRRALEFGANDPAAWREAARLLGEIGSPEVLAAHEQLARLAPQDNAVKLALAREALRFDQWEKAEAALSAVDEAARRDVAFYRIAAALAQASGKAEDIEASFEKLAEAAPEDAPAQFNLAAVRAWNADESKQAWGREALWRLTTDPRVRVRAAVELLKVAARQHDEKRLQETMARLQERFVPGWRADFPTGGDAGWARLVEHLKEAAAADGAESAAVLARWVAAVGQTRETLVWLESLPEALAGSAPVADVAAELSAELGDLDRVENYLRSGAWGAWPRDALTLAIASRLQRLRYGEVQGRATWDNAIAAAGNSAAGLRALVRLADAWRDADSAERALEAVVTRLPKSFWAYEALQNLHVARREVAKLWPVYDGWVRQAPRDGAVTIKWAMIGCIIDRVGPEMAARVEALRAADPDSAGATVALAAVRWRQGRPGDAVALISTLDVERQTQPATALWLGLAQADLGNKTAAAEALVNARHGGISAEELTLIRTAASRAKIRLPASL